MTRLTLRWHLRAIVEGPEEGETNDHSWHDRSLCRKALNADNPVEFLDRVRNEAWRQWEQRHDAADLLTRHLWPDEPSTQPSNWVYHHIEGREQVALREGEYEGIFADILYTADGSIVKFPRRDGEHMKGYHAGGTWFPDIASADPLQCPECLNEESFWNFENVDAGDAEEPDMACCCCGFPVADILC